MAFEAKFFDGKQIQSHLAQVEILESGLRIQYMENTVPVEILWPRTQLQIMETLDAPRPGVIACQTMEGARLLISDPAVYKNILTLVPSKNIKRSHLHHPWRVVAWFCAGSLVLFGLLLWSIPKTAPFFAAIMPASWDDALGKYAIKTVVSGHRECIAPAGRQALDKLVSKITKNIPLSTPLDVRVIQYNEINAFAVPGYHIVILSGLLKFTSSAEELAGILAHEMGHAIEHHPTQGIFRQIGISVIISSALGSSFDFASAFLNMKYTRENEQQADDIAVTLLQQANISTKGLIHFFQKMIKEENPEESNSSLETFLNYFSDHPGHQDRLQRIQEQSKGALTQPALTLQEWVDLKNICSKTAPLDFDATKEYNTSQ